MEYDRIILEMLDRIKTLEEKVAALEGSTPSATKEDDSMKVCKKYRRLADAQNPRPFLWILVSRNI